jgi:CubicO group peptidase (beta-lactamase class C family)
MALEESGLGLDDRVSEVWTQFATAGKQGITFRQVLSHTAGLCALDHPVPIQDTSAVVAALENQAPLFEPGTVQAYHARTFGFLVDEIVWHLTRGQRTGAYFQERVAGPMGLDFWMGLPETEQTRLATLQPGKMRTGESPTPFLKAFSNRESLTARTFASPAGLHAVQDLNLPETLRHGYLSMGGVGTARGLAAFYGMLAAGGMWRGRRMVSEAVVNSLTETCTQQEDAVLCTLLAFGPGVMRDPMSEGGGAKLRALFGKGKLAFGHPGAGGSLAFADPERKLSFAYVMNQMELGVLPNQKSLDLVAALDEVLA